MTDIFDYRAQYRINIEGLFDGNNEHSEDMVGYFLRIKNLMITEVHTRWDIAFLEKYIENMVPRSIRSEVNPQKEDGELKDWYKYFKKAGVIFLVFLVA